MKLCKFYPNPASIELEVSTPSNTTTVRNINVTQVEYALWHNHGVRVVQRTLKQLKMDATMDADGTLHLDGTEAREMKAVPISLNGHDVSTKNLWDLRCWNMVETRYVLFW